MDGGPGDPWGPGVRNPHPCDSGSTPLHKASTISTNVHIILESVHDDLLQGCVPWVHFFLTIHAFFASQREREREYPVGMYV